MTNKYAWEMQKQLHFKTHLKQNLQLFAIILQYSRSFNNLYDFTFECSKFSNF